MGDELKIGDVTISGRVLLAPMTGVSDLPFRRAAAQQGAAYVATEMVASALFAQGRPDAVRRAAVGAGLPLMVIQLVGRDPDWMAKGAQLATAAGADIIDLNMGCPAKEVTGALSGAALMRDLDLAERLIAAVVNATPRPVTVKMRLGWDAMSQNAPALAERAERAGARALTVHGRTRQDFYAGRARWDAVAAVTSAVRLPVIVNGDIVDAASARMALGQSGADAVMIGRGAYGRPWIARTISDATPEPDRAQRLGIVLDHLADSVRFYGDAHGLRIFRKHLGWYVEAAGWPACATQRRATRAVLCQASSAHDVETGLLRLWHDTDGDQGFGTSLEGADTA